jgi:anti-anti-sigma factor
LKIKTKTMEIHAKKINQQLLITVNGRLDASWSDYFTDAFLAFIRNGEHQFVLDAKALSFLSSAGIRSLVRITKELRTVEGSMHIFNATEFVAGTLRTTGFGDWLLDEIPAELKHQNLQPEQNALPENLFLLDKNASLSLKTHTNWKPWQLVKTTDSETMQFPADSYALGIGSPSASGKLFGDFMVVGGHVAYQSPEEKSRPDFLLPIEAYIPEMEVIQSLRTEGSFSHLWRFAPDADKSAFTIAELAGQALSLTHAETSAFVILAEIDGLVGAHLIQSPALRQAENSPAFPEIRDWLSFSGERVFVGEQAMIFGVVSQHNTTMNNDLLKPLPSMPTLAAHLHAAVFPYQPLQNGELNLKQQLDKFFNGPPPKALMHLIDDQRPEAGLGQSSLIRGAMWCGKVIGKENKL